MKHGIRITGFFTSFVLLCGSLTMPAMADMEEPVITVFASNAAETTTMSAAENASDTAEDIMDPEAATGSENVVSEELEDTDYLEVIPDAPVYWAANNGITTGTSETTFSPNATCTRAQVVTFLWRLAGEPSPSKTGFFQDVPENAFYAKAVYWAAEKGITTGTSLTTFEPDQTCTRGHVVTFLWRYFGKQKVLATGQFQDVHLGKFYYEAVYWALANHVTTGTSFTVFAPNLPCTRGQVVTFLYRAAGN